MLLYSYIINVKMFDVIIHVNILYSDDMMPLYIKIEKEREKERQIFPPLFQSPKSHNGYG